MRLAASSALAPVGEVNVTDGVDMARSTAAVSSISTVSKREMESKRERERDER